jgi:hypothetical protein
MPPRNEGAANTGEGFGLQTKRTSGGAYSRAPLRGSQGIPASSPGGEEHAPPRVENRLSLPYDAQREFAPRSVTQGGPMRKSLLLVCLAAGMIATVPVQAQAPAAEKPKDYTAHVVGYAHIDMAWLWRWEESIYDVMYNTFRNQLELMDQHPDFTFAQDQAIVYEMMEHYYPDIFKGIAYRVKTRNWIPVSSSWTQMDENMPDGESLARQFLLGQK